MLGRAMSGKIIQKAQSPNGSVLTEFAVVLPMLLFLTTGLLALGQLLGQLSWISQASYISTMSGADDTTTDGPASIRAKADLIKSYQLKDQVNGSWNVEPSYSAGPLTGRPILTVKIDANISPLMKTIFPMDLEVYSASALLLTSSNATYTTFGNPSGLPSCPQSGCPVIPPKSPPPVKSFFAVDALAPSAFNAAIDGGTLGSTGTVGSGGTTIKGSSSSASSNSTSSTGSSSSSSSGVAGVGGGGLTDITCNAKGVCVVGGDV